MTTLKSRQAPDQALLDRARALHKQAPLIDGHNDYPWALRERADRDLSKLDIPAAAVDHDRHLVAGGQGASGGKSVLSTVPAEPACQAAVTATMEEIDTVYSMIQGSRRPSSGP